MYYLKTFTWKNTNLNLTKMVKIPNNTNQGYINEYVNQLFFDSYKT